MARKHNGEDYARFSLEIERGEEEPSYSVSNRRRPGSRATSSRASSSNSIRYQPKGYSHHHNNATAAHSGGIQIIQDGFEDDQEWMIEDMTDDDDGHDIESMGSVSPLNNFSIADYQLPPRLDNQSYQTFSQKYENQQLLTYNPEDNIDSAHSSPQHKEPQQQRQLVVRERRDVFEVDTDEENDIVNKIRQEITQTVREEISGELKQLTNSGAVEDDEDIDPRVKEALVQMRKFDRILEKRTKRERRVKRERIALQRKLKQEIEDLNKERPSGCKSTKDETVNTERFLSLPPSIAKFDREVAEHSDDDDDWSGAPLFATEPQFDGSSTKSGRSKTRGRRGQHIDDASSTAASDSTQQTGAGNSTDRSKQKKRRKQKRAADGSNDGKDFIQRNIDLAADAGNTVAMTDDEKNRLADILEDLDEIEETLPETEEPASHHTIAVKPGEGFSLDSASFTSMSEIDRKLGQLIGQDEYKSILSAPSNLTLDSLFSRTHNSNTENIAEIGERALQETREYRDQQRRLADIENELSHLSTAVQSEIESPRLSDQQLHALLEQCNKMMSRATAETDSLSQSNSPRSAHSTARESVVSVTPQLDDNVLKALLDQARAEGIISRSEIRQSESTQPDERSSELLTDNQRASLLMNPRSTSRLATQDATGS